MVPEEGLEPTLLSELDFESSASAIPPLGPKSDCYLAQGSPQNKRNFLERSQCSGRSEDLPHGDGVADGGPVIGKLRGSLEIGRGRCIGAAPGKFLRCDTRQFALAGLLDEGGLVSGPQARPAGGRMGRGLGMRFPLNVKRRHIFLIGL